MNKKRNLVLTKSRFPKLIHLFTSIFIIFILLITPKEILEYKDGIELAYSLSSLSTENVLFYDYKVYPTQERFENGLIEDVEIKLQDFKNRNEFMIIKIYGPSDKTYLSGEYLVIESDDVPDLNIEYYLLKDLKLDQITLPNRTFLTFFEDFSRIINRIYLGLFIIFVILTLPSSIYKTLRGDYYTISVSRKQKEKNVESVLENLYDDKMKNKEKNKSLTK